MARAFRLVNKKWTDEAFTGEGASEYPGRWNSQGVPMVYASESASLALLEVLVHLRLPVGMKQFVLFEVEIPDDTVQTLEADPLPQSWADDPPPPELKDVGDSWIAGATSLAIRVPSAIVPTEYCILINPKHDDFKHMRVLEPVTFRIDPRLTRS